MVVSNSSVQSVQKTAVAFVDDNDLIADGEEAERDMNNMITTYDDLHAASGGNMQEEKSKFFGWMWRWKAGFKEIENKLQEIKVKGKKLHKKNCSESEKTLGVMISPALVWDKQFNMMIEKMKEAVRKLNNTEMVTTTASMCYNVYLIKNVHYGCGILSLSQKQENALKKIY